MMFMNMKIKAADYPVDLYWYYVTECGRGVIMHREIPPIPWSDVQ
jgi:hypothetical protein